MIIYICSFYMLLFASRTFFNFGSQKYYRTPLFQRGVLPSYRATLWYPHWHWDWFSIAHCNTGTRLCTSSAHTLPVLQQPIDTHSQYSSLAQVLSTIAVQKVCSITEWDSVAVPASDFVRNFTIMPHWESVSLPHCNAELCHLVTHWE